MKAESCNPINRQWRHSVAGNKLFACGAFMWLGGCAAIALGGFVLAANPTIWPVDAYVLNIGEAALTAALTAFLIAAWLFLGGRDFRGLVKAAIGSVVTMAVIIGIVHSGGWLPYGWIPQ
ncbi:MAG: hypothetical protein ACK595_01325 [Planctomycetota bacterium]|jgi:hypothetical protein